MIVLICGIPGSGKTTLAKNLKKLDEQLNRHSFVLDGDDIRSELSSDLGWTLRDRIEQAKRAGAVARLIHGEFYNVYVSLVCPTKLTRNAFGHFDKLIVLNRPRRYAISETKVKTSASIWEEPTVEQYGPSTLINVLVQDNISAKRLAQKTHRNLCDELVCND